MKSLANGAILKSGTVTAAECLRYALSLPTSVVITGIDSLERLEQAVTAARTFEPLTDQERAELLTRTEQSARRGAFELFKTTSIYDATASNPEWLGEEPERLQQMVQGSPAYSVRSACIGAIAAARAAGTTEAMNAAAASATAATPSATGSQNGHAEELRGQQVSGADRERQPEHEADGDAAERAAQDRPTTRRGRRRAPCEHRSRWSGGPPSRR